MFKEIVEVESVYGKSIEISFEKKKSCDCCRIASLCNPRRQSVRIDAGSFSLNKGDRIEVGIEETKVLCASILLFLLPAVFFVGVLAALQGISELVSFFVAFLAVCVYYVLIKLVLRKHAGIFALRIRRKL
jgi:positive regulator of sigma E activity